METTAAIAAPPKNAEAVKSEIVAYVGDVLDLAQQLAIAVKDEASADQATSLGVQIKTKVSWLRERREAVYVPLMRATEAVREEYDRPIKLGGQLEKTLSAAVIDYRLKVKRDQDRVRLEAEAKAKREREEAERKEREAAAERERIIRERREREEADRRAKIEAERQEQERKAAEERALIVKAQQEADARAAKLQEEQDARLKAAQEAHDVGLTARSEQILETQTPIAPIPAPLPSAAEREATAAAAKKAEDERLERERQAEQAKAAEEKRHAEEAEQLRKLDEEAALAKQKAAEAEAAASQQVTVMRPDDRLRTSVSWKYEVSNREDFLKLASAVAQGRAPAEYLGWDDEHPEKFRVSAIGKDVTRLKDQFSGAAIGIRTWPEAGGGFKVAKEAA